MERLPKISLSVLQKKISKGNYVLFFAATWCGDCKFIKPSMPEIEKDFPNYTFLSIDRDENIDLCNQLNVMGIPSFIVYHDGQEVGRLVNKERKTKEEVETFLRKVK